MTYEKFLQRWFTILLKVTWIIVPGALLLIAGHVIDAVVRVMMSQ